MGVMAVRGIVFAAMIVIATPFSAFAQETADGPIRVRHPALASSVDRLSVQSRTFRAALDALAPTGRRAVLTTPGQVGDFDRTVLAQAFPLTDADARIDTVVVVINLELLQKLRG